MFEGFFVDTFPLMLMGERGNGEACADGERGPPSAWAEIYYQVDTCTHWVGSIVSDSVWHIYTHPGFMYTYWLGFIVRVTRVHTLSGFYCQFETCTHTGWVLLSGWHVYTHLVGFIVSLTQIHTLSGFYCQFYTCTHTRWALLSGDTCTNTGWVALWHVYTHCVSFVVWLTCVHTLCGFYCPCDTCTLTRCVLLSGRRVYTHWVCIIISVTLVNTQGGFYNQVVYTHRIV